MPTANDHIAKLLGTEGFVTEKVLIFTDGGLKFQLLFPSAAYTGRERKGSKGAFIA